MPTKTKKSRKNTSSAQLWQTKVLRLLLGMIAVLAVALWIFGSGDDGLKGRELKSSAADNRSIEQVLPQKLKEYQAQVTNAKQKGDLYTGHCLGWQTLMNSLVRSGEIEEGTYVHQNYKKLVKDCNDKVAYLANLAQKKLTPLQQAKEEPAGKVSGADADDVAIKLAQVEEDLVTVRKKIGELKNAPQVFSDADWEGALKKCAEAIQSENPDIFKNYPIEYKIADIKQDTTDDVNSRWEFFYIIDYVLWLSVHDKTYNHENGDVVHQPNELTEICINWAKENSPPFGWSDAFEAIKKAESAKDIEKWAQEGADSAEGLEKVLITEVTHELHKPERYDDREYYSINIKCKLDDPEKDIRKDGSYGYEELENGIRESGKNCAAQIKTRDYSDSPLWPYIDDLKSFATTSDEKVAEIKSVVQKMMGTSKPISLNMENGSALYENSYNTKYVEGSITVIKEKSGVGKEFSTMKFGVWSDFWITLDGETKKIELSDEWAERNVSDVEQAYKQLQLKAEAKAQQTYPEINVMIYNFTTDGEGNAKGFVQKGLGLYCMWKKSEHVTVLLPDGKSSVEYLANQCAQSARIKRLQGQLESGSNGLTDKTKLQNGLTDKTKLQKEKKFEEWYDKIGTVVFSTVDGLGDRAALDKKILSLLEKVDDSKDVSGKPSVLKSGITEESFYAELDRVTADIKEFVKKYSTGKVPRPRP